VRALRWLLGLAAFAVLVWGILATVVFVFGRLDQTRPADAIVVLGAAQYDGRPSPVLRARLDHALALYEEGMAPALILTGGVGAGDTVSEAEVGRRYALKEGVPAGAILLERTGLSSEESMTAVAGLMRRNGMSSAVLVSDPFHMLRLRVLAWKHGIRSYSSPTRSSPIGDGSPMEWKYLAREGLILPLALMRDL
jgi:uncharacterized SAM-binding protein YcdF (DUF218 family)